MKVRRVRFNFSGETPVHYLRANIFSTHFVNSLHILFPEGERFFIRSLQKVKAKVKDEKLQQDIKDFCGQEGTHAHQHMLFWKVLKEQGFDIDDYARFYRARCYDDVESAIYKIYGEEEGALLCASITAALEHYTSMLAEVVFEHEDNWKELPDEIQHLLFWHAAEEIEHKAVAFDVLKHIDDRYSTRVKGMLIATVLLWGFTFVGMGFFIYQDRFKQPTKMPAQLLDFVKTIAHPAFMKFSKQWVRFFDKDFHPNQIDNRHFAEAYFSGLAKERYDRSA